MVIDTTNSMALAEIDVYNTPSTVRAVAAANGTIDTNNTGGISILRVLNLFTLGYLLLVACKATA
jgi:hypothetical protein